MTGRPIMLPRPAAARVIGAVEREVSQAAGPDALSPGEAHLGIRDLGKIGPQCTITSGLYASIQGPWPVSARFSFTPLCPNTGGGRR
jgi:hypothetical protein